MVEPNIPHEQPSGLKRPINLNLHDHRTALVLAWIIFLAALGLRVVGIGEYPKPHATDDEFGFLWGGLNFWDSGMPESWSNLGGDVQTGTAMYNGKNYNIVRPYLDHPPLFTIIVGGLATFTNPQRIDTHDSGNTVTIWDVNLARARWIMIPIFIATFWLLFSLAGMAFSPPVALLSVLFYGFMSHAVAHGRLILSDNLSAMLLLAGAWSIQRWLVGRGTHRQMAALVITFTAAATLTKIPAWCMAPALITMLLVADRGREIRYVIYGFVIGIILYAGWIAYCGFPEFISVMQNQSSRFRGFNAFQRMSGVPKLLAIHDLNGVVMAGWFCMIALALRYRAHPLSVIGPVFILAFTFFAGDVLFGWYTAPLYPWFALALAVVTMQVCQRPRSPMMIAWLLLFLPHAFQTIYIAHYELETALRYVYVLIVALLLAAFLLRRPQSYSVLQVAIICIVAVVLMREIYEITNQRTDRISDREKYFPEILVREPIE